MAFTDIVSYPVCGREFVGFWNQVNTLLSDAGGAALVLPGAFDVAALNTLISEVEASISAVNLQQTIVDTAANQIALLKEPVMERFKQLRRAFDAFLVGTKYARTLPLTPRVGTAGPDWIRPLQDAAKLWGDVNGDTALTGITRPITLAGGYSLARFQADSGELIASIQTREAIPTTLDPLINARDAKMKTLRDRCIQLRAAVQSVLAANDPLLASLPHASPPKKQSVGAVKLRLVLDPRAGAKSLAWTQPDADTERVSIRICAGPRYKEADSRAVADVAPSVLSWIIPADLLPDGATVWFKAVCVSGSGSVASSNAVKAS